MLGVPRTNVTMTVSTLQKAGLITFKRSQIEIVDLRGLELAACECYRIVQKEIDSFYK